METAEFTLTVLGDDQKPIVGAEAYIYAMRCKEDPGSHYGWPSNNMGKSKKITTDQEGKAVLLYPIRFGSEPDWLTTNEISIAITHAEYVKNELHIDPTVGESVKELKAGCELTVSARDASMQSTKEFGILLAGPGQSAKWIMDDQGVKRSRSIPDGQWQMMLVQPDPKGETLFSGIVPVRLKERQAVRLRDVPMRKGIRIVGALDEEVPRPVTEGTVLAWCSPKPAENSWEDRDPTLMWAETTVIQEDGSFVFPSLPRTGEIQLIAICRGWVIEDDGGQPTTQIRGIRINLDEMEVTQEGVDDLVLPMIPTGDLEVTVLTPEGEPLKDAIVSTWPNQLIHRGGSQILGATYQSVDVIRAQLDPTFEAKRNVESVERRYSATTNDEGKVVLKDIPLHHTNSVDVSHDRYQLPKAKDQDIRRWVPFTCTKPGVTKLSLIVEPTPKKEESK